MTTSIGIISDVHASPNGVAEALELFRQHDVSHIFCAGDIAGYFDDLDQTVSLLQQADCQTVIGNHDQSWLESQPDNDSHSAAYLRSLPEALQFNIEGRSIYMVHASPPGEQHGGIKLRDKQGQLIESECEKWQSQLADLGHDILIVGHTHQVYAEQLGQVLVINPGSSVFNHSCLILTLPEKTVQTFALEGHEVLKSWHFGMLIGQQGAYPDRQ